jgi:hypothetical protein
MIPSPQPQQRIVLNRPNLAGLPALQLSPQSAGILADSPRPGMLPMGGTAQVQAMGVDTSAGGQMRQKRSARRPK